MKLISIIIPAFNDEQNLPVIYQRLNDILSTVSYTYEFILINDGSRDHTWRVIKELALQDDRVKGINFSRNFGQQIALKAGYDNASGDAILSLDSDLQDLPELLPQMIKKWESGSNIVYARRIKRNDSFLKRITAELHYALMKIASDVMIPRNVGDFRLIDQKVLAVIKQCKEPALYLRGLVAWTGFRHSYVDFIRPNRHSGTSGYSWKKRIKLSLDGLTSFSLLPLRISGFLGGIISLLTLSCMGYGLLNSIIWKDGFSFTTWISLIMYLAIGLLFIVVWTLGEYVGRIFEQQKERPLYLIQESLNIQKK